MTNDDDLYFWHFHFLFIFYDVDIVQQAYIENSCVFNVEKENSSKFFILFTYERDDKSYAIFCRLIQYHISMK
ncbi:hypothetical protein DERP_007656 [Dermatophagoides pteronyssinus]|uniref:Uncharacterized protein n=1 Tax=Dermatophagoides pteronyssinus TaxID=6956 RepID=A0ABQ8JKC7_DERPT|nr:hypothetical protein DERP_007656 [Dermatophagoides pteronyssinus]